MFIPPFAVIGIFFIIIRFINLYGIFPCDSILWNNKFKNKGPILIGDQFLLFDCLPVRINNFHQHRQLWHHRLDVVFVLDCNPLYIHLLTGPIDPAIGIDFHGTGKIFVIIIMVIGRIKIFVIAQTQAVTSFDSGENRLVRFIILSFFSFYLIGSILFGANHFVIQNDFCFWNRLSRISVYNLIIIFIVAIFMKNRKIGNGDIAMVAGDQIIR